jgi:hypothetical protein
MWPHFSFLVFSQQPFFISENLPKSERKEMMNEMH